jgi:hypothetical protein
MTRTLLLDLGWIKLYVTVDVCDGMIDSVISVSAEGTEKPLKCDRYEFLKCFDGELAELLEEDIRTDMIAHAEMQMDAAREEGRL